MGVESNVGFGDKTGPYIMHSADVKPDFGGWATKANLQCTDGRTILPGAFQHQDKAQVPLVWQHGHSEPSNVLGHAILEHRDEGVYCYGYFNETEQAKNARTLVSHKDIQFLSIFANQLKESAKRVSHGIIREVSLVLAGANPGALIDNIELQHADGELVTIEDEAVIYSGVELKHGEDVEPDSEEVEETDAEEQNEEEDDPTVQDVYDSMTEEQQQVVHMLVGEALNGSDTENKEEDSVEHGAAESDEEKDQRTMSRNVFEQQNKEGDKPASLSHDAVREIVADAQRSGSLKEAVEDYALKHGIDDIDTLFPDARNVTGTPEFDKRRTEWVSAVMNGTNKTPFSRLKSIVADITHDEARAKGYIKGNLKKEEFFGLVKRVTTPSTVYKKQKLDRDDIIDITDFDVVAWLKGEMRLMLDEELARAVLVGDGREADDEDKIKDPAGASEGAGIRSILNDDDLYAARINITAAGFDTDADRTAVADAIIGSMSYYKGSGTPTLFTTLPVITSLLLTRDQMGRRLYRTQSDLAAELGVSNIVACEALETVDGLIGIVVNLRDYTLGADRGGDIAMFDDFDIDYNQYKYLIETRLSGALTKIRSALVLIEADAEGDDLVVPAAPTFDGEAVTIVNTANVVYKDQDGNTVNAAGSPYAVDPGESMTVEATAADGYYIANNVDDEWTFHNAG